MALVFQETNTPFAPDMIASHFLHAFIVVQPIEPCTANVRYRVTLTDPPDAQGRPRSVEVPNPQDMPDSGRIASVAEPTVTAMPSPPSRAAG